VKKLKPKPKAAKPKPGPHQCEHGTDHGSWCIPCQLAGVDNVSKPHLNVRFGRKAKHR
jgi:hypothetical protein